MLTSKRILLKHQSFVMQRQKDILYKLMFLLFPLSEKAKYGLDFVGPVFATDGSSAIKMKSLSRVI